MSLRTDRSMSVLQLDPTYTDPLMGDFLQALYAENELIARNILVSCEKQGAKDLTSILMTQPFQGHPFVHFVISKGYYLLLEWYLGHLQTHHNVLTGGDDHNRDWFGNTPLMSAVISGQVEIAELLLQYGADIHAPHNQGETPFLKAIKQQDCNVVRKMVIKDTNEGEHENDSCRQKRAHLQWMVPGEDGPIALLWATKALCQIPKSYIYNQYTAHYDTAFHIGRQPIRELRENLMSMIENRDKMVSHGREILRLVLGYYSALNNDDFLAYIAPCIGLGWRNQDLDTVEMLLKSTNQKEAYNVMPLQVYSEIW